MSDSSSHRQAIWRSLARSTVVVVVLFTAFAVLPLRGDRWWLGVGIGTALLATIVPFTVFRLRRVLASERPAVEAFEALVQLLAMLIVGFGAVYYAMNRNGSQVAGLDTRTDSIYFTVTTLSTVGFGDITATSQAARIVVTVQIVFDLIFIGIAFRVFATAASLGADRRSKSG